MWDGEASAYSLERHVDDLIAVLEALGARPAHLVGRSYGGAVAALAAAVRPDLVCDLLLAEPTLFAFAGDGAAADALDAIRVAFGQAREALGRGDVQRAVDGFVDAVGGEGASRDLPGSVRGMLSDNAHTLSPMFDTYLRIAEGLRECRKRYARIVPLAGASHGLQLELPEVFTAIALAYFGSSPWARQAESTR